MFPLLSLPYLAINNVLDMVYPNELFILSMCSKRTFKLIKHMNCVPKRPELEVITNSYGTFGVRENIHQFVLISKVFEVSEMPGNKVFEKWEIGDWEIPIEIGRYGILNTYWNDQIIGMTEIINYGMDLFNKPISYLATGTRRFINEPIRILDWINSFQKSISECYLESDGKLTDENITYFLNNLNVTDQLVLYVKTTNQFQFNSKSMEMKTLMIHTSHWFNRNNLLSMNCKYIYLEKSKFSGNDINSFLHHWMNGGCPKLKELSVYTQDTINWEDVLKDLEVDQSDSDLKRRYHSQDGVIFPINGRFDIRNEELTATLLRSQGAKSFIIVVWPDIKNNYF